MKLYTKFPPSPSRRHWLVWLLILVFAAALLANLARQTLGIR